LASGRESFGSSTSLRQAMEQQGGADGSNNTTSSQTILIKFSYNPKQNNVLKQRARVITIEEAFLPLTPCTVLYIFHQSKLGDRPVVGRQALNLSTGVRILLPQPESILSYEFLVLSMPAGHAAYFSN
jgi:hypothetical protein